MDWNKISEKSLGDKYAAIVGVLALLFIACSITIVFKGNLKDLWVLLGIITLLLVLLTTQRGATVFLTAMVLGTLVAREDFLLQVAALYKGTSFAEISQARSFEGQGPSDTRLVAKVSSLETERNQIRKELVQAAVTEVPSVEEKLKNIEKKLDVAKDASNLSVAVDKTLRLVATRGPLSFSEFEGEMKKAGLSSTAALDDLQTQLFRPGYAKTDDNRLSLTPMGIELAKQLGLTPVSQEIEKK